MIKEEENLRRVERSDRPLGGGRREADPRAERRASGAQMIKEEENLRRVGAKRQK